MSALQYFVRGVRIGAIVMPVAAGISYAIIYGMDYWFKLGCREPNPIEDYHFLAVVWLVLAVLQITGYKSPPRWLDIWKIIVFAASVFGIYACWDLYYLPPLWDNCQNIGVYDYADDFIGVDFILMIFAVPMTVISAFVAMVAAIKWQMRKDAEGTSPW